jgi:hypothetical protein
MPRKRKNARKGQSGLGRLWPSLRQSWARLWQRLAAIQSRGLRIGAIAALMLIAGGAGYLLATRDEHRPPIPAKPPVAQLMPPVTRPLAAPPPAAAKPPAAQPQQQASVPAPDRTQPAWLRYAVAPPPLEPGKPLIAIVIDDMGLDRPRSMRALDLPAPLTMS